RVAAGCMSKPSDDARIDDITEALLSIARLEFGHRAKLHGDDGPLEALASVTNMLSEEVKARVEETKAAEAALRERDEQLRQAQKLAAIGRFAGGVAHDYNNMMSVVLGHVVMLLDDMASDDPRYEPLVEVRQATERAAELTQRLLAFSRHQPVEARVVDL